jgi:hypothetical protein
MRATKETMQLECLLTDKEKLAYGKELSEKLKNIAVAEGELDHFKAGIKDRVTAAETRASVLARAISTGTEFRSVECDIIYDWKAKTKTWIRKDNKAEAKQDIISEFELQEELKLTAKKDDKKKDKPAEKKEEKKA